MPAINRSTPRRWVLSAGLILAASSVMVVPAAARTNDLTSAPIPAQIATATAQVAPTFKQIGQIGQGSVESIGWITASNQVEIRVGETVRYYSAGLKALGTLDLKDRQITAIDHNATYTALGFNDGRLELYRIADQSLYATLIGHTAQINSIEFSGDQSEIITASNDGTARVWDVATHRLLQTLTSAPVGSAVFNTDKINPPTRAYSYNAGARTLWFWNIGTGANDAIVHIPTSTWTVLAIDPTLRYVATNLANSLNNNLTINDTTAHTQKTIVTGFTAPPTSALFSADGKKLYIASLYSGQAAILDSATLNVIQPLNLTPDLGYVFEFSSDGTHFIQGFNDGSVQIVNLVTGQITQFKPSTTRIKEAIFNHAADRIFVSDATGKITVWDLNGKALGTLDNGLDVLGFYYETPAEVIVTTSSAGDLAVWDAAKLTRLGMVSGFSTYTTPIVWSPDGRFLAGAGTDNAIHIWDTTSDAELRQLKGNTLVINAIAWSPDGRLIASASSDLTVRLWVAATGQLLQTFTLPDRNYAVAFSPNSSLIAVGSRQANHTFALYSLSGTALGAITTLSQTVTDIQWRPHDANHLLAVESNGMIAIVTVTNPTHPLAVEVRNSSSPTTAAAWSPDGSQLITASSDRILRFWSYTTANGLSLQKTVREGGYTYDLSWNKTGAFIAITDGNIIRLFDPTGTQIGTITGHTSTVYTAEWSPDGTRLATSSYDGTIRFWKRQ